MLTLFARSLPIHIHPFFVVLAIMIGWLNSGTILGTAIWTVVVFFSVLIHEFGHALMGILFSQSPQITLFGMGGATERRTPTRLKPWKEFILVFCGPLFGFVLAFLAKFALGFVPENMDLLRYTLTITYIVNLFWTILNLFPIHPMDGGKLSMILLEHFFGVRGIKISLGISFILAAVFGVLFLFANQIIIGALFILFAFDSWRAFQSSLVISPEDNNNEAKQLLKEGEELLAIGRKQFAKDKFLQVQKMVGKGMLYSQCTMRLAEIAYSEKEYLECLNHISELKSVQVDKATLKLKQKALMQLERYKEALKVGEELFLQNQDTDAAAKNALLAGRLHDAKATLGWLKWIKKESKPTFDLLINNADFEFLKDNKDYIELISK